jgi:hypothetical protein
MNLKPLLILLPLLLTACVNIELPHIVEDTAKVSKSAYQALSGKRDANRAGISHSYIGNDNQSTAEMKQHCETEAAAKLRQMVDSGAELRYNVLDNEIVTINGRIAANCRLAPAM